MGGVVSERRRECRSCGAHTMTDHCGNCGSFDVRPVEELSGEFGGARPLQRLLDALYPPRPEGDGPPRLRGF